MTKFRDRKTFDAFEIEGALCAWEYMLSRSEDEPYADLFKANGYGAMRMVSQQAGHICSQAYARMEARGYDFDGSYDWDFVPAILDRLDWSDLIDDNQYNGQPYEPDIDELLELAVADLKGMLKRTGAHTPRIAIEVTTVHFANQRDSVVVDVPIDVLDHRDLILEAVTKGMRLRLDALGFWIANWEDWTTSYPNVAEAAADYVKDEVPA